MADRTQAVRPPLTRRQQEVLALLADGLSNEEIAERLKVSATAVQTHVWKICMTWGVDTREELCRVAADQAEAQCSTCVWTAEAQSLARLLRDIGRLLADINAQLAPAGRGRGSHA